MRPVDVTHQNAQKLYKKLYSNAKHMRLKNKKKKNKGKFQIGDVVRISKEKGVFYKGYRPSFKSEKFIVSQKLIRDQIVYKVKDYEGGELSSIFYEPELVRVRSNDGGTSPGRRKRGRPRKNQT